MKLQVISVGTRAPVWLQSGFDEYNRRLPAEYRLHLQEIPVARRTANAAVDQLIDREGEKMLACVNKDTCVVALEVAGQDWSTEALAKKMSDWQMQGRNLAFFIGGPDGLSNACRQRADFSWSLSRLTFPHFLVRVLLAEQIYRCWTLMNNHPYHK